MLSRDLELAAPHGHRPVTARFRCLLRASLLLSLSAFGSAALAADEEGKFAVKGMGLATCEQFLKVRDEKAPQYYQFGGWVNGYLSAVNRYEEQTFDIAPWQSTNLMINLLGRFCEQRKDLPFVQAVRLMVNSLEKDRLTNSVERVEAKVGDKSVYLYEATMRLVQLELTDAGFYNGKPDGKFGRQTRKALEQYQAKMGIPKTGLPDQLTLARIFYK